MKSAARKGGASSDADGGKRGVDAARVGLSAVATHVSDAVTGALLALMEQTPEPGPEWVEAEGKIRSALDGLLPSAMAVANALWESDGEESRKALKQQQTYYELKLDTARSAAKSQLANQQAELVAHHNRDLEGKLAEMSSGGELLLKRANERAEELQKQLDELTKKSSRRDDLLARTQQLLKASEEKATTADAARKQAYNELAECQAALERAEAAAAAKAADATGLHEQIGQLRQANAAQEAGFEEERKAHAAAVAAAKARHVALEAEVASAQDKAEHGQARILAELELIRKKMHDTELAKEEIERLCEELKGKLNVAGAEERQAAANLEIELEHAKRDVAKLNGKLMTTQALLDDSRQQEEKALKGKSTAEQALAASVQSLTIAEQELERLRKASAESGKWLQQAQAEASRLHKEVTAARAALSSAAAERQLELRDAAADGGGEGGVPFAEYVDGFLRGLERQHRQEARELEQLKQQRDEIARQLEIIRNSGADIRAERDEAKRRLAEATEQLEATAASMAAFEDERRTLQSSLEYTQGQVHHYQDEARRLNELMASQEAELHDAQERAASAQAACAELEQRHATEAIRQREAEEALRAAQQAVHERDAALSKTSASLSTQLVDVGEKLATLRAAAKSERTALVSSALFSLQQLKEHLTSSLAGLRVGGADSGMPPPAAAHRDRDARRHRWGVRPREAEYETFVVRLDPPPVPPMHIQSPPLARIATGPYSTIRASSTGGGPRGGHAGGGGGRGRPHTDPRSHRAAHPPPRSPGIFRDVDGAEPRAATAGATLSGSADGSGSGLDDAAASHYHVPAAHGASAGRDWYQSPIGMGSRVSACSVMHASPSAPDLSGFVGGAWYPAAPMHMPQSRSAAVLAPIAASPTPPIA